MNYIQRNIEINEKNAINKIKLIYSEHCRIKRIRNKNNMIKKRRKAVVLIQNFFKKTWAKYMIKRKLINNEINIKSCCIIQKIYRGRMVRKRTIKRLEKSLFILSKIRILAYTFLMLKSIRKVRLNIIKIQSNIRKFICRLNYVCFVFSLRTLQYKFKSYNNKKNKKIHIIENHKKSLEKRIVMKYSTNIIMRNYNAYKHNRVIINFITLCSIAYDLERKFMIHMEYDMRVRVIQRVVRKYLKRKIYLASDRYSNGEMCTYVYVYVDSCALCIHMNICIRM